MSSRRKEAALPTGEGIYDPSALHDRYLGTDAPHDIQFMGNDHNRYAHGSIDMAQHLQNICRGAWIKRRGRLIAQQQLRTVSQCAGNRYPLALSAAELSRILPGFVRQADELQTFLHPLHPPCTRHSGKFQRDRHIPADSGIADQIEMLKDHPDSLPLPAQLLVRQLRKPLPVNRNHSCIGPLQQIDQPQERGFARAAGANNTVNGTRLHFKRYLIDSLIRAILQSEALANLTQRKNMKPSFTDCLNVLSEPQGILYYNYLKSVSLKISLNNKVFLPLCHHLFQNDC